MACLGYGAGLTTPPPTVTPHPPLPPDVEPLNLPRLGGHLALDFVNTAEYRGQPNHIEFLTSPQRLLAWCGETAVLPAPEFKPLWQAVQRDAAVGAALLARGLALRESLRRVLEGQLAGQPATPAQLRPLNEALRTVHAQRQLVPLAGGLGWGWRAGADAQVRALGPLCLSAQALLTSPELHRLRQCAGGCGWWFLDTSRNRSRRWCSMDFCGNQSKSRRQYQRTLAAATGTAGG